MRDFLNNAISSELFLIYGLIGLVIILILVIIIVDKVESKKKQKNLFDTLNMKIISDAKKEADEEKAIEEPEEVVPMETVQMVEIKSNHKSDDFSDLKPIDEVKEVREEKIEAVTNNRIDTDEDYYVDSELEKTQAQIRVEEITKALESADIEIPVEEDKYAKFEEEQEKNAIISYNELKKSFDKLYSENEKVQYLEDEEIPINIDELYELQKQLKEKEMEIEQPKVRLDDFTTSSSTVNSTLNTSNSSFRNSPYISPVYGIQRPKTVPKEVPDTELQDASQFLNSLKELKSNLE